MSFTRFYDDECRIQKQLQESTDVGRYMLNVPGNGDKPSYFEDPFIRLQGWGGNLMTNPIDLESSLRGIDKRLDRCIGHNNIKLSSSNQVIYPENNMTTDQSRATDPAWLYRDLEQVNLTNTPVMIENKYNIPFANNISSRIQEKDNYNS